MNMFTKFAAVALLAAAPAVVAHADSISGTASLGSSGTFTANSITFATPTSMTISGVSRQANGVVTSSTGTMIPYQFTQALLNSFNFSDATPITLFTAYSNTSATSTLSFVINSIGTHLIDNTGNLFLSGSGIFNQTGFTSSPGYFTLSSTTAGVVSFTISSAVTPEPNSLLLLGTGLVGAATTVVRRRRMMA